MATKIPYVKNPDGSPGEVWNPVVGCTKIKSGCKNCWAERLHDRRYKAWFAKLTDWTTCPGQYWKPFSEVQLLSDRLNQPLHWRKPRTIFVCSVSDIFHKDVPFEYIDKVFTTMDASPRHRYMLFTKRWARAAAYFRNKEIDPNIHLYFSASYPTEVAEAVDHLLPIPVARRGLSLEPLLGYVIVPHIQDFDSVIVGCESLGHGKPGRPCKLEWIESIVAQCQEAGVPVYVKQIDTRDLRPPGVLNNKVSTNPEEWPPSLRVREF